MTHDDLQYSISSSQTLGQDLGTTLGKWFMEYDNCGFDLRLTFVTNGG